MKHGLLVLLIAASGSVSARSGVEAIALTDIELVEGAGATVALVDDKNCRLDGKVVLQKPVNAAQLVMHGGWELDFSSKTCTQGDGTVHKTPFAGVSSLPVALKRGARIQVVGQDF